MKTYKISLGGRGSECFIFPIDETQYQKLLNGDVESDKMELDDILETIEVEDIFDSEISVLGAYDTEYYITVSDENGDEIWNSETESIDHDNTQWVDVDIEGDYLVIEDYSKGNFFNFYVETEDDFNPNKIGFIITEVADSRDIITSIKYDNEDLSDTKEYDDYWSKGFYYILKKR